MKYDDPGYEGGDNHQCGWIDHFLDENAESHFEKCPYEGSIWIGPDEDSGWNAGWYCYSHAPEVK